MKTVIYSRVGTLSQLSRRVAIYVINLRSLVSVNQQIVLLRDFATTQGVSVTDQHIYREQIAENTDYSRPVLKQLLADVHKGQFDLVIVQRASYLARNIVEFNKIVAQMRSVNIRLYLVDEQKLV